MSNRPYDIILWGASGFTGRLVAEYIQNRYAGAPLTWAMAGRNKDKLESIKSAIGAKDIDIIVADSMDRASLDNMTAQGSVICTTVGPYAKYGSELVTSCIKQKTDYCDLTGEVQWMRRMIDNHHDDAVRQGVRIVHTCGFDSVPSDMGVYYTQKTLKEKYGSYAQQISMRVKAMKGGMSGGTYASMSYVMEEAAQDKTIMQTLFDPYGLNPNDGIRGLDAPDLRSVVYDKDAQSWLAPFVMAVINTKVVRRSHALMDYPYGQKFKYDEAMMTGDGIGGRMKGYSTAMALGVLMGSKPGSMMKKVTDKILPDPGEGPNEKQRNAGFYNLRFYCKMDDGSLHVTKVTGDKDPGYGSTSKMLAEAAICLAKDKDKCPDTSGMLTPATALGDAYLTRLETNAGLTFELV